MGKGSQVRLSGRFQQINPLLRKASGVLFAGALLFLTLTAGAPLLPNHFQQMSGGKISTRNFVTTQELPPLDIPVFNPISLALSEPEGCKKPPEGYEIVQVNGNLFNRRTLAMLQFAAELYQGELEITGYHITQGSYHDNGAASFGTHLGGGAVDLSVMREGTYTILENEIPALIAALRTAGFAAWLREPGEVFPGSSIHIHAIAIGDRQLSTPALEQLTGKTGYFRGYTGLPLQNSPRTRDRHGGPIICGWMKAAGFHDLRRPDRSQP